MALIKCSECGREISDQSDKCIHCGCPIKTNNITQNTIPFSNNDNIGNNSPFFSNKDSATNTKTIMWVVCGSLFLCSLFISGPLYYILMVAAIIVALCMGQFISYLEVDKDTISGCHKKGKKFSIKIQDITNVTLGEREITIYTGETQYTVNCGDKGKDIIDYINSSK